ncbi:MAG: hypothetical protein AAFQ63_09795 [Cyanobacteria bacterium J06621_11]
MLKKSKGLPAKGLLAKVLALNILAIVGTVALSAPFGKVLRQFEDGGFITYFSVIQLFILSYFACQIFKIRRQNIKHPWQSSIAIWAIISLGFSFLALDDLLMIHEWFDKVIHGIWQMEETALSDRIDDLIVGLYGLLAIGGLVYYRQEIKKYKAVLPTVIIGFVLLFLMVGVDVVSNRDDILLTMFSPATTANIMSWIFIPEESLKLLSEAFLIIAAHNCLQIAKQLSPRRLEHTIEQQTIKEPKPSV